MPNRKIDKWVFYKFAKDNSWLEIYNEPAYNLVRYVTPMGVTIDTSHKDDYVIVEPLRVNRESSYQEKLKSDSRL